MSGLSLTRKEGQAIAIGDAIVTVKKISASRVVLRVEAPDNTAIVRLVKSPPTEKVSMMQDLKDVTEFLKLVKNKDADEVRLVIQGETRLRAIYLAAVASQQLSIETGYPESLAKLIFVETETLNRAVLDCSKMLSAGKPVEVLQVLQKEITNEHAFAIVSLLEELRPRSSRIIAQQCERVYDNPELMGLDT